MALMRRFLEATSVADCVGPGKNVVVVDCSTTLKEALQILKEHGILSAPLRDPKRPGEYVGLLDVKDILLFAIRLYAEKGSLHQVAPLQWEEDVPKLKHQGIDYALQPVGELVQVAELSRFTAVSEDDSLFHLVQHSFAAGWHRAAVFDQKRKVVQIISQSDVLACMADRIELLGELGHKTVQQLGLGSHPLVFAYSDSLAILAFYQMHLNAVTAIAVIDRQSGELLSSLSASDMRRTDLAQWTSLFQPITTFFKQVRPKPPVTCTPATSLEKLMKLFSLFRVHHIWILGNQGAPIGVVSLSDIMKLVAKLPSTTV